jgi:hypothetical protein
MLQESCRLRPVEPVAGVVEDVLQLPSFQQIVGAAQVRVHRIAI